MPLTLSLCTLAPLALLLPLQIPTVNSNAAVEADAESVAAFFSATCAPSDAGALTSGAAGTWDGLCTACQGNCTTDSPYYDYPGSMRCLMEGAGGAGWPLGGSVGGIVTASLGHESSMCTR